MSDLEIREFELAHLNAVVELWEESEGVELDASDEPDRIEQYLSRNPGLSFVAFLEGCLVGAALCGHDGRRGYLYHLAVARSTRRSGIGKVLVDRCLAELRATGITKCHILVFRENRFGELFWGPNGWDYRENVALFSRFL